MDSRSDPKEWHRLAEWLHTYGLVRPRNVRWMVQMPRVFNVYRAQGDVANFADYLRSPARLLDRGCLTEGHIIRQGHKLPLYSEQVSMERHTPHGHSMDTTLTVFCL